MADVGANTDIAAPYQIMTAHPVQNMLTANPIDTVQGIQNIELQQQRQQLNRGEMVRQQLGISSDKLDLHKKQLDYAYSQIASKVNDPDLKWADIVNGVNDMATDHPELLSRSQAAQILAHGPKFPPKTGDPIQDRENERAATAQWAAQHAATLEHSRQVLDFMQGGVHEFKDANGVVHYQNDQQFRANMAGGASPNTVVGAGGAVHNPAPGQEAPGTPVGAGGVSAMPGAENHFTGGPSGSVAGTAPAPAPVGGFAPGANTGSDAAIGQGVTSFGQAQKLATSYPQRMQPLKIMHDVLQLVGPSATGPATERLLELNRLAAQFGLKGVDSLEDTKNVDVLIKAMAQNTLQQAAAGNDTDAHAAMASIANPNAQMSLEGNKEVLKNLIAVERMKQVGYAEFTKTKLPPQEFPQWFATKFAPNVDMDGFRHDLDNKWENGRNVAQSRLAEMTKPGHEGHLDKYHNAVQAMQQNNLHWGDIKIGAPPEE